MRSDSNSNLNPGSPEAVEIGCRCPVLDNGHGQGSGYKDSNGDPAFWINEECPIHNPHRKTFLKVRKYGESNEKINGNK